MPKLNRFKKYATTENMIFKNLLNRPHCIILFLALFSIMTKTQAESINIAVASNFITTAKQLAQLFEQQTKHKINISGGSSGKLFVQIKNAAPYDLFLSADIQKPKELVRLGLAVESSRQTYALGQLSLWLKKGCHKKSPLHSLISNHINRIAIANPNIAPYGASTKSWLIKKALWLPIQAKLVFTENISQTAQLAKLAVVDAAFIAHSQNSKLLSTGCIIKLSHYPLIKQQLVLIKTSNQQALAKQFIQFLYNKPAQNLIKNMGYILPTSAKITLLLNRSSK